jgi:microcystin-dependent protein
MYCEGQILQIAQNQALYAIIGNQLGGDGRTTFMLPDLRGRMAVGSGSGTNPTLTGRTPGQSSGSENVQLTENTIPPHNHSVKCDVASPPPSQQNTPVGNLFAAKSSGTMYAPGTSQISQMNLSMVATEGQSQGHENMPPWLALRFIICVNGYFPIRP